MVRQALNENVSKYLDGERRHDGGCRVEDDGWGLGRFQAKFCSRHAWTSTCQALQLRCVVWGQVSMSFQSVVNAEVEAAMRLSLSSDVELNGTANFSSWSFTLRSLNTRKNYANDDSPVDHLQISVGRRVLQPCMRRTCPEVAHVLSFIRDRRRLDCLPQGLHTWG